MRPLCFQVNVQYVGPKGKVFYFQIYIIPECFQGEKSEKTGAEFHKTSTAGVFNPLGCPVKKRMDFLIYTMARPPGYFRNTPHGNCELNFYSFVLAGISKHKHVVVIPARARKFTVLIMGS